MLVSRCAWADPNQQPFGNTPQVETQVKANNSVKHQKEANKPDGASEKILPSLQQVISSLQDIKREIHAGNGSEEGTEFWPTLRGFRIKITDSLLVLFTAVLAYFTYRLDSSTRKLWRSGEEQIKLAREEFNSTHRPKIIARGFYLSTPEFIAGQRVRAVFVGHNIGDTEAKVIEVRSASAVLGVYERVPNNSGIPNPEKFDYTLVSGGHEVFPINGGNILSDEEVSNLRLQTHMLVIVGVMTYIDAGGIKRETGFCRRYRPTDRTWDVVESEYEYAY